MIKLTPNPIVLETLKAHFPKPANSAQRALDKYINLLQSMVTRCYLRGFSAEERKLGLYRIPLKKLSQEGGQIGPQKIRIHKWLQEHQLDIVEPVVRGSNLTGEISQVKLSELVSLENKIDINPSKLSKKHTDKQIDRYLTGEDSDNVEIFKYLYPDFQSGWTAEEIDAIFDRLPIDIKSLKAFIVWLATEAKGFKANPKSTMLRQAKVVLAVATVLGGVYLQRKKASPFGRMYYEGISVQSVHKELRRAMLGDCWEYDMRSSVVAWKLGFAREIIKQAGIDEEYGRQFSVSRSYVEEKGELFAFVRSNVFDESSNAPPDLQVKLLKQAFTAISFGARHKATGWQDSSGVWRNPAILEILKNADERERFLKEFHVKAFIQEQTTLDTYIYNKAIEELPSLLKNPELMTVGGSISRAKVMAFLYQHAEKNVMDLVQSFAEKHGRIVLARVHDAIFFKRRIGSDLKFDIQRYIQTETYNPFWHLTPKELKGFILVSQDEQIEIAAHKKRIAAEEERAKFYKSKFSHLSRPGGLLSEE